MCPTSVYNYEDIEKGTKQRKGNALKRKKVCVQRSLNVHPLNPSEKDFRDYLLQQSISDFPSSSSSSFGEDTAFPLNPVIHLPSEVGIIKSVPLTPSHAGPGGSYNVPHKSSLEIAPCRGKALLKWLRKQADKPVPVSQKLIDSEKSRKVASKGLGSPSQSKAAAKIIKTVIPRDYRKFRRI